MRSRPRIIDLRCFPNAKRHQFQFRLAYPGNFPSSTELKKRRPSNWRAHEKEPPKQAWLRD